MKIIITSLLFLTAVAGQNDPSCASWKAGVDQLNANRGSYLATGMEFSCKFHPEKCEQIDCVGKFNNPLVGTFEFCWNMVLNHCDNPINMDVSISIDKFHYNFFERVTHSDRYPLSIQSKNLTLYGAPIHEYISFTLMKVNDTAIQLGMQLSTEMCLPHNLGCTVTNKIPLMPDSVVPVSRCNKVTVTPKPKTPKCAGDGGVSPNVNWTKLFSHTTLPPHSTTRTATYGKKCSIAQLIDDQCGQNEMCKQGVCDCFTPRYPMCSRTGFCQTVEDCERGIIPDIPGVTSSPQKGPHNDHLELGPTNKTAVIVGSTLGVIVVLVIVVGVILWRRSKSRYTSHQLLLTEEDTDGII